MTDPPSPWAAFRRVIIIGGAAETRQWRREQHIPSKRVIHINRAMHVVARLAGARGPGVAVVRLPGYDPQATAGLLEQRLAELQRQGAVDLT